MPVPKRKRSRARRDKRFANKGMMVHAITACQNCQSPLNPHVACKQCGHYKGAKVLVTKDERAASRVVTRQAHQAAKASKFAAQQASAEGAEPETKE